MKKNNVIEDLTTIIAFLLVMFVMITGAVWIITLCIDFWKGFF